MNSTFMTSEVQNHGDPGVDDNGGDENDNGIWEPLPAFGIVSLYSTLDNSLK